MEQQVQASIWRTVAHSDSTGSGDEATQKLIDTPFILVTLVTNH